MTALELLNNLINIIGATNYEKEQEEEASNTLGGCVEYYFNKFSIDNEKNQILKESLKEFDIATKQNNKQKLDELQIKYIFAYFFRAFHEKAVHIINNKTNLKEYILTNIMTKSLINNLNEKAKELLLNIKQNENKYHSKCIQWKLNDAFLVVLGDWFNKEFFIWYKPKCNNNDCIQNGTMKYIDMVNENEMKEKYENEVSRIHIYQCSKCQKRQYFKRFYYCDSMIKYKQYRRGWCGDHVDVFAAIINAFQYKWRFALDDTDHIWLEIYSNHQNKWCCFEPSPETPEIDKLSTKINVDRFDYPEKFANRTSRYILAIDGKNKYKDITYVYQRDKNILEERRKQHLMKQKWVYQFLQNE